MVIEAIPREAIPFKCERCGTVYLLKPSIADEFCRINSVYNECKCTKQECKYYESDIEGAQCPVCKTRYSQERIGSLRYKLIRAFSKRVERGSDME